MARIAPQRSFYIPANSTRIEGPDGKSEAYIFDSKGRPAVMLFIGKAQKPTLHMAFVGANATAARDKAYQDRFQREMDRLAAAAKAKAERNAPHSLTVGQIMVSSWGFEQTNIDFYEVIATTAHTVTIREIKSEIVSGGGMEMAGKCRPVPGAYASDQTRTLKAGADNSVKLASYAAAWAWDGRDRYFSTYA